MILQAYLARLVHFPRKGPFLLYLADSCKNTTGSCRNLTGIIIRVYKQDSCKFLTGFLHDPARYKRKGRFLASPQLQVSLARWFLLGRNAKYITIHAQVCFHIRPFAVPVRPRCPTGSLWPVNGINKDVGCTKLLPTTVSSYPVDLESIYVSY